MKLYDFNEAWMIIKHLNKYDDCIQQIYDMVKLNYISWRTMEMLVHQSYITKVEK